MKKQQGFTIIEVVLVLAIAGLIFLMVFIALPALQRGQRDTGRKNDVSTVVSALNTYLSNNKGTFSPGGTAMTQAAMRGYVDKLTQYDVSSELVLVTTDPTPRTDQIAVRVGYKCPTSLPAPAAPSGTPLALSALTLVAGSARQAAVVTALENNGTQWTVVCQDL